MFGGHPARAAIREILSLCLLLNCAMSRSVEGRMFTMTARIACRRISSAGSCAPRAARRVMS